MQRVLSHLFLEVPWATLAAAASRVRQVLRAYSEARGRAASERELHRLSDHMLRDIGLYHGEHRR
jgi:uncharacterized protein YjiS (DUF1127 family)